MGFDLMSLNCSRGHFIDHVNPESVAADSGLKNGDMLLEIDGVSVRDLPHDQLVEMLKELSLKGKYGEEIKLLLVPDGRCPIKD